MTDPDLEIRAEVDHSDPKMGGGGGGPVSKKNFASVWSKSKGGVGPPGPSPGFATEEGRWLL